MLSCSFAELLATNEYRCRDNRIVELDEIVEEVKQSEEWEAVKMNILEIGVEKGRAEGRALSVIELLSEKGTVSEDLRRRIMEQTDDVVLREWLSLAARVKDVMEFDAVILGEQKSEMDRMTI